MQNSLKGAILQVTTENSNAKIECCKRVLGYHPYPSCTGEVLGFGMVSFKAGGCGQGVCLNRRYGVSPECDSLDHRLGACYLPCGLLYHELCCAVGMPHSRFPPPHFECALYLVNQCLHHSGVKMDVLRSLINSCSGPETCWLNVAVT